MSTIFEFGSYELHGATLELRRAGHCVDIEPKPLRLLLFLIEQRHRVVPKDDLLRAVWGDAIVGDAALAGALHDARRAVGDDGTQQRWIRTRQRLGYQFLGPVVVRDAPAGPSEQTPRGLHLHGQCRGLSTSFVGRSAELAQLEALLTRDSYAAAHVSIEGPAGAGKTELALQLVHKLAHEERFPGGIFWLDAELADLTRLWGGRIADQLGMAAAPCEARGSEVLQELETRDRRALLVVLDNVESWAPGARPGPLPAGPHVRVLVTTRRRNLGGARFDHLSLGMLPAPHDRNLLERLAGRLLGSDADALLAQLGGHALALELAGAFLGTYLSETPSAYLTSLHENAEASEARVKDRVGYEGTVAQAFRSTWQRLAPAAREAWWLASFFESEPVPREVSQACGIAPEALQALEENHLIEHMNGGAWTMHRLTREFGARLPPERSRALDLLMPMGQHLILRSHLKAEFQRIYQTASGMVRAEDGAPDQIALSLFGLWYAEFLGGHCERALTLASLIEESARKLGSDAQLVTAYRASGTSCFYAGRPQEAVDWCQKGLELSARSAVELPGDWLDARLYLLAHIGLARLWLGYPDEALRWMRRAAVDASKPESHATLAALLLFTSLCHYSRGEWDEAERLLCRVSALEEGGRSSFAAFASLMIAAVRNARGDPGADALLDALRKGMQRCQDTQLGVLGVLHWLWLSAGCQRLGLRSEALDALDEGRRLLERTGERLHEAELWRCRAALASVHSERVQYLERALQVAEAQGSRWLALRAATDLAEAAHTPQAHAQLAQLYARFSEGLELPDLRRARAALGIRSGSSLDERAASTHTLRSSPHGSRSRSQP